MSDLNVIVYTMKWCPFCDEFKTMLKERSIDFFDRDIHDNSDEYELFTEITQNEFIPALLVIESDGEDHQSYLYAPDRNYNDLEEAIDLINEHRKKVGII